MGEEGRYKNGILQEFGASQLCEERVETWREGERLAAMCTMTGKVLKRVHWTGEARLISRYLNPL
jgi:hypothetical protein